MRLMRAVLLLVASAVCFQAHAESIKIRFLNGIQNSPKDMEESKNALFNAYRLYKSGSMPTLTLENFSTYQNPKDKLIIGDNVELAIQGTISGIAQKYAKDEYDLKMAKAKSAGLKVTDAIANQWYNTIYQRTLTEYYSNYLAVSNSGGTININGVIIDTLARLRSDLSDGSRVVIVSHSQGNLFAEAINSQLSTSEKSRVRFVGVASVASSTPNNRYVTFNTDLAVFGAFNGLRAAVAPLASAPLPKTDDGYYAGPEGIASFWDAITAPSRCVLRTINCPSFMGHSFTEVYLNSSVAKSSDDLTPIASKIVGMIGDSINELIVKKPQGTINATFEGTNYTFNNFISGEISQYGGPDGDFVPQYIAQDDFGNKISLKYCVIRSGNYCQNSAISIENKFKIEFTKKDGTFYSGRANVTTTKSHEDGLSFGFFNARIVLSSMVVTNPSPNITGTLDVSGLQFVQR